MRLPSLFSMMHSPWRNLVAAPSLRERVTVLPESKTSLEDLQGGPFVLIGAFDNDWLIMFSDPLRFHFRVDEKDGSEWIGDREHPEAKVGLVGIEQAAEEIGIERFGAHNLRRTWAKLCRKGGGDLEQI